MLMFNVSSPDREQLKILTFKNESTENTNNNHKQWNYANRNKALHYWDKSDHS